MLLAFDAIGLALAALLHTKVRASFLEAYAATGAPMPRGMAIALSSWLLPSAMVIAALAGVLAVALPLKPGRRSALVAAGITLLGFAITFVAWETFVPIFAASS